VGGFVGFGGWPPWILDALRVGCLQSMCVSASLGLLAVFLKPKCLSYVELAPLDDVDSSSPAMQKLHNARIVTASMHLARPALPLWVPLNCSSSGAADYPFPCSKYILRLLCQFLCQPLLNRCTERNNSIHIYVNILIL